MRTTCGVTAEDTVLQLACPNSTIAAILFADYGTVQGECPAASLNKSDCSADLTAALHASCVGHLV